MKTEFNTVMAASMLLLTPALAPASSGHQEPFKAEIDGIGVGVPCGVFRDGFGTSSHFGKIVQTGIYCGLEFVGPGLLHLAGQGDQTGPNGESITFTFDEIVDFNTTPLTADGTWNITGGTGRFVDATGGGTFHTIGTLAGDTFALNIKYVGTISY